MLLIVSEVGRFVKTIGVWANIFFLLSYTNYLMALNTQPPSGMRETVHKTRFYVFLQILAILRLKHKVFEIQVFK